MSNGPFYAEGKYLGRVISQALGKAGTGTPQFMLRFLVLEKIDGDRVTQYERTLYRAITDKTIPYVIEDLQALGYTKDSFKYLDPNVNGFHDFAGQEIEVFCKHEARQDGTGDREKWGIAKSGGELKVDPLESAKVRELDNLFGKALKAAIKTPALAPQKGPQPAAKMATEMDDVPF